MWQEGTAVSGRSKNLLYGYYWSSEGVYTYLME